MALKNTDTHYGALAKFFHWVSALVILVLCLVGLSMTELPNSPEKFQIFAMHKSFGILILILVSLRIGWRLYSPAPEASEHHASWEKTLAKITHLLLYVAMIGMPLSGWVMSSSAEYPVPFFGINLPPITGKNEALHEFSVEAHEILAYVLMALIALHAAGAFKHYFIDRDDTLARMSFARSPVVPALLAVLLAAFFAAVAYLGFAEESDEKDKAPTTEAVKESAADEDQINLDALPSHGWAVVKGKTTIGFTATLYGQDFNGQFQDYDADIVFDPENLKDSLINIRIKTDSAQTGSEERDAQIVTYDWFASENYEYATFRSKMIEQIEGSNYIAVGDLTLRGKTLPVSLPFTLEISNQNNMKQAHVTASASLNRLDFGVGQGQWADTQTVAAPVRVVIDLTARAS